MQIASNDDEGAQVGTQTAATEDDPLAWMERSACLGLNTNLFHESHKSSIEYAKAVCKVCPVVKDCLEYALPFDRERSWDKQIGIYGGLTTEERRLFWDRVRRNKWPSRGKGKLSA